MGRRAAPRRRPEEEYASLLCQTRRRGRPRAFIRPHVVGSFSLSRHRGNGHALGVEPAGIFLHPPPISLAVQRVEEAIRQCQARGLLGEAILGTDFRLKSLRQGRGRGRSSAGRRPHCCRVGRQTGAPQPTPYPAERGGSRGLPTSVNNVKTYTMVPSIFMAVASTFSGLQNRPEQGDEGLRASGKGAPRAG